jgi:hypothetical protein
MPAIQPNYSKKKNDEKYIRPIISSSFLALSLVSRSYLGWLIAVLVDQQITFKMLMRSVSFI